MFYNEKLLTCYDVYITDHYVNVNLSLNDFISAETLITWLHSAVVNNKYHTLMLHEK